MNCILKGIATSVIVALCAYLSAAAQCDFQVADASGVNLCYQKMQGQQWVRVTHPQREWPYYAGSKPSGSIVIPSSVTWDGVEYQVVEVGDNAFYGCDSLVAVDLGRVRRVGSQAFYGCTMLDSVVFPYELSNVGDGAFAYCRSLRQLSLTSALTHVGTSAFSLCTGLQKVVLSTQVEDVCDATTFHGVGWMKEAKNQETGPSGELILTRECLSVKKISN